MKLSSELDHTDIARPLDHITGNRFSFHDSFVIIQLLGPYWVDPRERMTFKMYLKELITADGHQATGMHAIDACVLFLMGKLISRCGF